jgi:uncharacterized membrane protein YoaK (UPF0700 family)
MPYTEIAITVAAAALFLSAGEMGARDGSSNHGFLWAALSVLLSVIMVFVVKSSNAFLVLSQVVLFAVIGVVRGMRHE